MNTLLRSFPTLRVEPLHTVHDSLVVQFREADREWAGSFVRRCFDNPMAIAGITLTIPVAGECSKNWAMKNSQKL